MAAARYIDLKERARPVDLTDEPRTILSPAHLLDGIVNTATGQASSFQEPGSRGIVFTENRQEKVLGRNKFIVSLELHRNDLPLGVGLCQALSKCNGESREASLRSTLPRVIRVPGTDPTDP